MADLMTTRDELRAVARAIFHIIARVRDLSDAQTKIVELLDSIVNEALVLQKAAIVTSIVDSLKGKELPHCNCGKHHVDVTALIAAVIHAFDVKPDASPNVN